MEFILAIVIVVVILMITESETGVGLGDLIGTGIIWLLVLVVGLGIIVLGSLAGAAV